MFASRTRPFTKKETPLARTPAAKAETESAVADIRGPDRSEGLQSLNLEQAGHRHCHWFCGVSAVC